jgi:hypothetical protein
MGIRFYCPNGHKLHVKSFLAGKRGICPHCGVTVDIPFTSTRPSSRELRRARQEQGGGSPVSPGSAGQARPAAAAGIEDLPQQGQAPQGSLAGGGKVVPGLTSKTPERAGVSSSEPAQVAQGSVGAVVAESPRAISPASSAEKTLPKAPATHTRDKPARTIFEPLEEDPNAVWYVMPASGGRYGPASPAVMRTWLMEGRIGLDTLVWRSGWPDWRSAEEVFPNLARFLDSLASRLAASPVQEESPAISARRKVASPGTTALPQSGESMRSFLIPLIVAIVIGGISIATIVLLLLAKNLGS